MFILYSSALARCRDHPKRDRRLATLSSSAEVAEAHSLHLPPRAQRVQLKDGIFADKDGKRRPSQLPLPTELWQLKELKGGRTANMWLVSGASATPDTRTGMCNAWPAIHAMLPAFAECYRTGGGGGDAPNLRVLQAEGWDACPSCRWGATLQETLAHAAPREPLQMRSHQQHQQQQQLNEGGNGPSQATSRADRGQGTQAQQSTPGLAQRYLVCLADSQHAQAAVAAVRRARLHGDLTICSYSCPAHESKNPNQFRGPSFKAVGPGGDARRAVACSFVRSFLILQAS
ncbi:hypothetical protein AK812_SmicGene42462 [Symbiodinium microadriaticum]|uniref:Uncharacterized protein n=1 Tax=Symbiodinium microadriaticum TaxID=2951 RepID=A0A1Q9C3H6_SYMMI|nr:hypothetical protein AK812_SmicGene42462 [Symbiodinium microadriaticum]